MELGPGSAAARLEDNVEDREGRIPRTPTQAELNDKLPPRNVQRMAPTAEGRGGIVNHNTLIPAFSNGKELPCLRTHSAE